MTIIFLIFFFIIGTAVGSFLNVLIDRLPNNQSIMGRSRCDYCKRNLEWFELIPIVSFIIQNGKSRCCHKKISFQYPLVEAVTGIIFIGIWNLEYGMLGNSIFLFGIVSCLIVIFVADLKYQIIPDSMQIVLLILVLIFNFQFSIFNEFSIFNSKFQIPNSIFSGLMVMLPILLLYLITKGKGMGFGDVKLAFIMGILLGIKSGLIALYLAFVMGGVVGLILILFKKKKLKSKIAFGPFLVIGTVNMLFFNRSIIDYLYKIYGY